MMLIKYNKYYSQRGGQAVMKNKFTIVKDLNRLSPGKIDWHRLKTMSEKKLTEEAELDPDARLSSEKELLGFKRVKSSKQIDGKKIRKLLKLSQEKFAAYFGISGYSLKLMYLSQAFKSRQ